MDGLQSKDLEIIEEKRSERILPHAQNPKVQPKTRPGWEWSQINRMSEPGPMHTRGYREAETKCSSCPGQESSKMSNLRDSGRMLARGAPESQIQS